MATYDYPASLSMVSPWNVQYAQEALASTTPDASFRIELACCNARPIALLKLCSRLAGIASTEEVQLLWG